MLWIVLTVLGGLVGGGALLAAIFDAEIRIGAVITSVLVGLVWIVVTLFSCFHTVEVGHAGVIYSFGNIVGQTDSGIVKTAPWQKVVQANVQTQKYQFKLTAFSKETQDVFIEGTLNYEVSPRAIQKLYRTVGRDWFDKLVPTRLNQTFKDETVKYLAANTAPNREVIRTNVVKALQDKLTAYSVTVDDINIDNIDFEPGFKKAIEDKQIATQEAQAAQNRVAKSTAEANAAIAVARGDAQAKVIAATAEAQANRLKRITLTPLLVQQNAIDKLNPNVSVIMVPSGSNLLLPGSVLGK